MDSLASNGESETRGLKYPHPLKNVVLISPVQKVRIGSVIIDAVTKTVRNYSHQPVWVMERQGTNHDRIDDTKDGSRGANPNAKVNKATAVKPGFLANIRRPYLRSCSRLLISQ